MGFGKVLEEVRQNSIIKGSGPEWGSSAYSIPKTGKKTSRRVRSHGTG